MCRAPDTAAERRNKEERNYPCMQHEDNRDTLKCIAGAPHDSAPKRATEYTMRPSSPAQWFLTAILLLPAALAGMALPASAQQPVTVSPPSKLTLSFMAQQRASIDELARRALGQAISGDPDRDVRLLQRLLDRGIVRAEDVSTLQAMGVVLGDLLASELGLDWVMYDDDSGRSRALHDAQTDTYLFPVTMISRRQQVGNEKPVAAIYADAKTVVKQARPKLPFQ